MHLKSAGKFNWLLSLFKQTPPSLPFFPTSFLPLPLGPFQFIRSRQCNLVAISCTIHGGAGTYDVGERPHHRGRGTGGAVGGGEPPHPRRALRGAGARRLHRLPVAAPHLRPPPAPPPQAVLRAPRHALPGELPGVPHEAPVRLLPRGLRRRLPRPPPLPAVRRLRAVRPRRRPLARPGFFFIRHGLRRGHIHGVHRAVAGGGHGRERGARPAGVRGRRVVQGLGDPRVGVQVRRAVPWLARAGRRVRQLRHGGVPGPVRPRRPAGHGGPRRRPRAPARDAGRGDLLRGRLPAALPPAQARRPPPGAPRGAVSRERPAEARAEAAGQRRPAGAEEQQGQDARAGHRRAGEDPRRGDRRGARREEVHGRRGGDGGRELRGGRRRGARHRVPQQRPTVAQGKRLLQRRGVPEGGVPGGVERRVGALLRRLHAPRPRRSRPRRRQGRRRHRRGVQPKQQVGIIIIVVYLLPCTTTTAGAGTLIIGMLHCLRHPGITVVTHRLAEATLWRRSIVAIDSYINRRLVGQSEQAEAQRAQILPC